MSVELQIELSFRVLIAALLASVVGYNRQHTDHPAGLRTHILIGIGASLFTILSLYAFGPNNPGIVAAQIVSGIGFLGAGSIIKGTEGEGLTRVRGITTAAGVWTTAAIGMACGADLYVIAILVTLLSWIVLEIVVRIEKKQYSQITVNTMNKQ